MVYNPVVQKKVIPQNNFLHLPVQQLIIHGKTLYDVFSKPCRSPLAKLGALMTFYPVTYRDNDIQVVVIGRFGRKIGISDFSQRV